MPQASNTIAPGAAGADRFSTRSEDSASGQQATQLIASQREPMSSSESLWPQVAGKLNRRRFMNMFVGTATMIAVPTATPAMSEVSVSSTTMTVDWDALARPYDDCLARIEDARDRVKMAERAMALWQKRNPRPEREVDDDFRTLPGYGNKVRQYDECHHRALIQSGKGRAKRALLDAQAEFEEARRRVAATEATTLEDLKRKVLIGCFGTSDPIMRSLGGDVLTHQPLTRQPRTTSMV